MANEKKSTATNTDHSTHISNIDYIKNAQDVQEVKGLKIDPTFRDMIPKLTDDEFSQLEKNILEDGKVKEPIVVWNGTIIDGHHRFYVVLMHPEIPYEIEERDFDNEWAVMAWACANQLGRRNLSDKDYSYLIGKQYNAEKMARGGSRGNQYTKVPKYHSDTLASDGLTREEIAKEHGIGSASVQRWGGFANGVDIAEDIMPGAKEIILHGDADVPKSLVQEIPRAKPDIQKKIVEDIVNNRAHKNQDVLSKYGMVDDGKEIEFTSNDLLQEITDNFKAYIHSLKKTISIHNDIFESDKSHILEEISKLFDSAFKEFTEGM